MKKFFRENQIEKKLLALLHKGVGQYSKEWEASDPDAEEQFITWLEARKRFARRPMQETLFQLNLMSVPARLIQEAGGRDKPIQGKMEEQGIQFAWEEFPVLSDTFRGMFRKARSVEDTELILALLVDTGALFEHILRGVDGEKPAG